MTRITTTALLAFFVATTAWTAESWLPKDYPFWNVVPPAIPTPGKTDFPVEVAPFVEHVRAEAPDIDVTEATGIAVDATGALRVLTESAPTVDGAAVTAQAYVGDVTWCGTASGLYQKGVHEDTWTRHASYGVDGPLSTRITAMAADSKGNLWVGTPLGLSVCDASGQWRHLRGKDGLPYEDITALAITPQDELWIGASRGAILYKPEAEGRQWFYRAGRRYLPGDGVKSIAVARDGKRVYFLTDGGLGQLDLVETTLLDRAQTIERLVNERHRRLGMVAACRLNEDGTPTIGDNDNDGLWTAYHVAAMSLCYGATRDEAALRSAKESMHAMYMLENASGIPGLPARSVVPPEIGKTKSEQWRPTPDGTMYWKSDTSSDEIDGHYLAFYTYFEHIAQYDPAERELLAKQTRELTDYLIENNYQLIDWDGKRTTWGFWNPENLNGNPVDYIECGLNSLQILSFLKVAHYVTGDQKYEDHYRKLILEHKYLNNILLTKKCFPDENNHSDDQLGFVAWYPILQLEQDPRVRRALLAGVRRHYAVVKPEQPSFYTFAYATIDPAGADIDGAIENLRQIPTDRRQYAMINSHRDDVVFSPMLNRFDRPVLYHVLPADERSFDKWNGDPYVPDEGGDGTVEDDGAAYLLPYWMGRYHGFITEATKQR
ncbi:two-component regulator propeller domain-containing protein [Roseovarius pacificus]|uniref:two-component regulator propeller domain-containing protein n=1 Tax=Roseovarius pacificus TaxID=337701 RepID=UPI002A18E115|nr:two-component regulator propeller domain-containing protein [Roseovarius pacificus]